MADPRVEKLAQTLVEYSVKVKPGDWVVIASNPLAEELTSEVLRYTLRAGGNPSILLGVGSTQRIFLEEANEEQLKWLSPFDHLPFEQADVYINIDATENTRNLSMVDSQKQQTRSAARREIMQAYMRRSANGELRWTLTQFPCQAFAQEADMSQADYADFVYRACKADQPDPVKLWNEIEADQARLVQWLAGRKQLHIRGANVDIQMSIEGRTFVNSTAHHNMPGSEIFTGPVEDSVNGWVHYTYPAIRMGREVEGIRLEFKDGKVIQASAEKNEEYLLKMLDQDAGARFLGELGIGTNYSIDRFTKSILYDEKMGGTIHMALGASYPETGGKNQSALHWDMICDMRQDSEITVDGDLFYKNGQFQV